MKRKVTSASLLGCHLGVEYPSCTSLQTGHYETQQAPQVNSHLSIMADFPTAFSSVSDHQGKFVI